MRSDFINAEELVNRLTEAFYKHEKTIESTADTLRKLEQEYKKLPSDYLKAQKELNAALLAQGRAEQQLVKVSQQKEKLQQDQIRTAKAKLQLQQTETRNLQAQEKAQVKANAALEKANNLYNKVQTKVNGLAQVYNNLATKRELGIKLNTREEAQLLSLEKRLNKYQGVLKNVDAGIGKYTRNVGNYASGFNPLNNAIGQITRELPNFGQSFGMGVLSITNNIGALQDSISQLRAQNQALIAQGQPVKSVFSQILSSVLSWNTALYVGIGLFSAFSDEIGDFFASLLKGKTTIDAAKQSAQDLNEIRLQSAKSVVEEQLQLQGWLQTAQDVTLSYKERETAANNILKQYPFFFEALGKEKIMNGDVAEAVKEVNAALLARAKSTAAVGKITKNQAQIIDLEEKELQLQQQLASARMKAEKSYQNLVNNRNSKSDAPIFASQDAYRDIEVLEKKIAENRTEINSITAINNRLTGYYIDETKKAVGLDYEAANGTKKRTEALKDYLASYYEVVRTQLENEASFNEQIMNDEAVNYQRREQAATRFYEVKEQLALLQRDEEIRLIDETEKREIASIQKRVKDGEITERNGNNVIYSLQKESTYKRLKVYEDFGENMRQINKGIQDSMKGVWDKINFQKAENLISERDLRQTQEYADTINKLVKERKDYRQIEQAEKDFALANRSITKANIQLEIDRIETELRGLKDKEANVQKRLELENQLIRKQKELTDVTVEEAQKQAEAMERLQRSTENYLQSFRQSFLSDFGLSSLETFLKIEENGKSMFANLMEGANTTAKKFGVAFNSITEVAQEAYNMLNQNSQYYFDAQYSRLDKEKETALKFAGESESGRAEIERQYEEKRREIRIREAKAQKEQALFNAIINTAQAVVAALPNIGLSILIGAIGAAQIALIAGRPLPAYAEGTDNHPGGQMLVNDGKGSNYMEMIKEPGKDPYMLSGRNRVVSAPKGTKVLNAEDTQNELNRMLADNNISPFADVLTRNSLGNVSIEMNNGISEQQLDRVMGKHFGKITTVHTTIDERGIRSFSKKQHAITEHLSNVKAIKGFRV